MKTIFILNPFAGKKKNIEKLTQNIKKVAEKENLDVGVYVTKAVSDATEFVKNYCKENGSARFIAVGGDGTLSEVLNGAMGIPGVSVGVMPMGTGNDFCRNFDKNYDFNDILMQIKGESEKCDAIKYKTVVDGKEKEGFCINMFNIGFDCNTADTTNTIKKSKILSGSLAYFASILVTLIKRKCTDLKVELDGEEVYNGKLLLTSIASGSFCGGGVKSNPLADVHNGRININIIKKISRSRFITLLPAYMKGRILEVKNIDKYIKSVLCKKVTIIPKNDKIRLCVDGEIVDAGKTEFEIVKDAFDFVLPLKEKQVVQTS